MLALRHSYMYVVYTIPPCWCLDPQDNVVSKPNSKRNCLPFEHLASAGNDDLSLKWLCILLPKVNFSIERTQPPIHMMVRSDELCLLQGNMHCHGNILCLPRLLCGPLIDPLWSDFWSPTHKCSGLEKSSTKEIISMYWWLAIQCKLHPDVYWLTV